MKNETLGRSDAPKITIKSRSDVPRITINNRSDTPTITVNSRNDTPKITINSRSDIRKPKIEIHSNSNDAENHADNQLHREVGRIAIQQINIDPNAEAKEIERERIYQEKLDSLIADMPNNLNYNDKVRFLFAKLVDSIKYPTNLHYTRDNDGTLLAAGIPFLSDDGNDSIPEVYKNYGGTGDKQPALIHGLAVCEPISQIFKDLCDKTNIDCELASNLNGNIQHAWNIVKDASGKRSRVDVTYGIWAKARGENDEGIYKFCMYDMDESQKIPKSNEA